MEEEEKIFAVFLGSPVEFEATVAAGSNLTFDWAFDNLTHHVTQPYLEGCQGKNCSASRQVRYPVN